MRELAACVYYLRGGSGRYRRQPITGWCCLIDMVQRGQLEGIFTTFAPAGNRKIAVGVLIGGGDYGAAPIAVAVIKAYLKTVGIQ
jgi:hypothetical protein